MFLAFRTLLQRLQYPRNVRLIIQLWTGSTVSKMSKPAQSAVFHPSNFESTPTHSMLLATCRTPVHRGHLRDISKIIPTFSIKHGSLSKGNSYAFERPGYATISPGDFLGLGLTLPLSTRGLRFISLVSSLGSSSSVDSTSPS
jgi:hypothetical protein